MIASDVIEKRKMISKKDEAMNITHICLNGPVTDGWNYQDNLLPKYQMLNGNNVTVITSKWIWNTTGQLELDSRTDYYNEYGIRTIRLPMKGKENLNRKFKTYRNLYKTVEQTEPDILFIHDAAMLSSRILARYLKKHPSVIAYADNHGDLSNSGTNWISKNILHKVIWKHYVQIINPYIKKFYGVLPVRVNFLVDIYNLPREKCELLVLGADDELIEKSKSKENIDQVRKKYNIGDDDFLVMTGGKIDLFKMQTLYLMEAVKNCKLSNIKLIVFGSVVPELRNKINELADGQKVQFIGWVDTKMSYQYFAAADLVVFPGRHSVFWEQVAAEGIPMLCKDLEGTHHVDLGGNVKFLKEDSVEEIQREIERLVLNPEEYKIMKQIASEKGARAFSYKEIAKKSIEE